MYSEYLKNTLKICIWNTIKILQNVFKYQYPNTCIRILHKTGFKLNIQNIITLFLISDKLSTLVNGYGVFYLGFNQNIEIIIID